MGKSKRRKRYDETEEERQERLLDQVKMHGRQPTPRPGHFHKTRKAERLRLKDLRYTAMEEAEYELIEIQEPMLEEMYSEDWEPELDEDKES
jgi:hypothetical protein